MKAAIETQVDAEKFQRDLLTIVCKGKVRAAAFACGYLSSTIMLTLALFCSAGPTMTLLLRIWVSKRGV